MIILNQKTQKTTPSLPQSPSSHSSHKSWLGQAQQQLPQEPQAPFSHQLVLADKTQKKELAKEIVVKVVVEAMMVVAEEAAIQEEPTILETPRKNKESYPHLLMEEAQKRPLTSLFKWLPTYNSTDKSTSLKRIDGTSSSANFKEEQQDPGQLLWSKLQFLSTTIPITPLLSSILSPSNLEFIMLPKMLLPIYEHSAKEKMNQSVSLIIDSSLMHLSLEFKKMLSLSNSTYRPFKRKLDLLHLISPFPAILADLVEHAAQINQNMKNLRSFD